MFAVSEKTGHSYGLATFRTNAATRASRFDRLVPMQEVARARRAARRKDGTMECTFCGDGMTFYADNVAGALWWECDACGEQADARQVDWNRPAVSIGENETR